MKVNTKILTERLENSFCVITELADTIVRNEDISFREAHSVASKLVSYCTTNDIKLSGVSFELIKGIYEETLKIPMKGSKESVLTALTAKNFIEKRTVEGGIALKPMLDMYLALLISAAVLLPLSLWVFGPYYLKIVRINRLVLYSAIGLIAILGVYAATSSSFQMGLALLVGILMYYLKQQGYPNIPFILGVILGPLCEQYLRTSLTIGNGNPLIFLTSMDSLVFLVLTIVFAVWIPRLNKKTDVAENGTIQKK